MDKTGDEAISKASEVGQIVRCLRVRCFQSKALLAHVVPKKATTKTTTAPSWSWGPVLARRTKIILKSDNESSIGLLESRARFLCKYKNIIEN